MAMNVNNPKFTPAEYTIVTDCDNKCIRHVKPYIQELKTYAKGRWIGRQIVEVLTREFGGHPEAYWINAVNKGHVQINGKSVCATYKFKNSDTFLHRTHRHEPPVFGDISLVGETSQYMAVCKPPSLPMHPCGAYRHNSLEYILKCEHLVPDQPTLHIVHRLDRVTSGLVVLAKTKDAAAQISRDIRDKTTKKVYLARVKGRFPADTSHLKELCSVDFASVQLEDEDAEGVSKKRSSESSTSAGASSVSVDQSSKRSKSNHQQQKQQKQKHCTPHSSGGGQVSGLEHAEESPEEQRVRPVLSKLEVGSAPNVGYKYEGAEGSKDRVLWLQCPIGVVSHRDGVHACDPEGKASLSGFRLLGYCSASDTSLVECQPYTGRTHQLRLHLQLLGNPIANDPCYGGQLFYHDESRRKKALEALKAMRRSGHHPLSKVPHFDDSELDAGAESASVESSGGAGVDGSEAAALDADLSQAQGECETDDDYLVRTCRYCRDSGSSLNLEHLLHCDGIWLHALRYTGAQWSFETPFPDWATHFELQY